MNKFIERAIKIQDRLIAAHKDMYDLIAESDPSMKSGKDFTQADYVDFGIIFRDIENMMDEIRKEAKARHETAGRIIAMIWSQLALANPNNPPDEVVRGELGSASPNVKQQGKIPERGTPEYFDFLKFLGFPKEVADKYCFSTDNIPTPLKLSVDWNGLGDWLTYRAAAGLPVPPSIGKTYPVFSSTFRRSKKQPKIKLQETKF